MLFRSGLSKSSKGSIRREEILKAAQVSAKEQNLDLISASDINIIGSELISGGDINMQAVDDIVIAADQVLSETKEWSEKTSFLKSFESVYEREEDIKGNTQSTAVASSLQSGGDINIESARSKVIGSDLGAEGSIRATTDVGDIEILSAGQSTNNYSKYTKVNVGLSDIAEQMLDIEGQVKNLFDPDEAQAKLSIARAEYDQVDSQTQSTDNRASSLVANNNIELNAAGDIAVQGSDVIADADVDGSGDVNLTAGGDVAITESVATTDTQTKETHGKGELSFVVQHQAVEVVKAARALEEAKDQLKQAEEDYRQYKKDLKNLKKEYTQLRDDYANGEPGILYDDVVELRDLIDEVESDEEWYQAGIALAATNLVSKTTLLAQQTAAAAASVATYGFNAGVQLDVEASKTDSQSHTEVSRGSTVMGSNINIQTGSAGNLDASRTQITGSHLQADNEITINTGELAIEASRDNSNSNTDTKQGSIRIAQTVYGAAGGPTVSADFSRSRAKDSNTTFNNSTVYADTIRLNSTGDTTIKGANIDANDTLDVNVGGDLLVQSVQNKYSANSNSAGISAGFSLGAGGNAAKNGKTVGGAVRNIGRSSGSVSSVSGGLNASNSRTRLTETVLTSLTGENVNINVGGHTGQVGSLIAAVDKEGNDNGNLTLKTQSYDYANLSNTAYSSGQSAGISTSIGLGGSSQQGSQAENSKTDERGNPLRFNTSNVNFSNDLSFDKSKTLATLGSGNIVIGSDVETGEDSTQGLNRDVNNTEKQLYSHSQSQSVEATIDTRLLTKDGRKQIKNDFVDTYEFGEDIYRASEQLNESDQLGLLSFWSALHNNTQATQLKNDLTRNPENAHILEGLTSGDGEQYAQAMQALGALAQNKFGLDITSVNFYDSSLTTSTSLADTDFSDVKGATVIDPNSSQYGNIFIDSEGTKNEQVNTLGHEVIETFTLQSGGNNDDRQEALANAFGGQFEDRIDQATGSQLSSTSTGGWSQSLQNSESVNIGTQAANQVGNSAVDYRQLHKIEVDWIKKYAGKFAAELCRSTNECISQEEAENRLTRQAFNRVQYGTGEWDDDANKFLRLALRSGHLLPSDPDFPDAGPHSLFYATPAERANINIYANQAKDIIDAYQQAGIEQPTLQEIIDHAKAHSEYSQEMGKNLIIGSLAISGVVLAPVVGSTATAAELAAFAKNPVSYCLANPVACTIGTEEAILAAAGVPYTSSLVPSLATKVDDLAKPILAKSMDELTDIAKLSDDVTSPVVSKVDDLVQDVPENNIFVRVDNQYSTTKGTPEYEVLNNPPPNSQVELSNGTTFRTGEGGYVDEITYKPLDSPNVRDSRQTAVGKEGIAGDVGGHIQACRHGGTCDRFNLFPQNSNFNNSAYKVWENKITDALKNGDDVGNVTVRFNRVDPYNSRPDSLTIEYEINSVPYEIKFNNQPGG